MVVAVSSLDGLPQACQTAAADVVVTALTAAERRGMPEIRGGEHVVAAVEDIYLAELQAYKDAVRAVLGIPDERRVVVHCMHGLSRSPALAIAMLYKQDPALVDQFLAQHDHVEPNPLLLLFADELLGADGDLLRRCRNRYKGRRL